MAKRKRKRKLLIPIVGVVVLISIILLIIFFIQQTIFIGGLSKLENITETVLTKRSSDTFCSPNMFITSGSRNLGDDCEWEGYLSINQPAINLTLTPHFNGFLGDSPTATINAKYEVLNLNTQIWEEFWNISAVMNRNGRLSLVCDKGVDGGIAFKHKRGDFNEIQYYCCATPTDPLPQGDISGDIKALACITPKETVKLPKAYSGWIDTYYHAPQFTFDTNYIDINKVNFRITGFGHLADTLANSDNYGFTGLIWEEDNTTVQCTQNQDCWENVTCDNSSIWIRKHTCNNNKCSLITSIPPESCINTTVTNQTTTNQTTNQTYIECWKFKNIIQQTVTGEDDNCIMNNVTGTTCSGKQFTTSSACEDAFDKEDKDTNWLLYIVLGSVLVIVIIIVIVLFMRKKRK